MRLLATTAVFLATVTVFFVTLFALALLGIWVTTLLGGNAWWGMVLVYPQLLIAIVAAVLFLRRWNSRPTDINGNAH
jgi:hypothetical protein